MKKILSMTMIAATLLSPMAALAETEAEAIAPADVAVTEAATTEGADMPTVGLANPYTTCTEEEAFAQIGQAFVIAAPEGFVLTEAARLSDELINSGTAPSARFAFNNEAGDLYRVHITTDLAGLEATDETPAIDVNGVQAIYSAEESSISFGLSNCMVTIDKAGATEDELKSYIASIVLQATEATVAEEAPAIEPEVAEAEEAVEAAE